MLFWDYVSRTGRRFAEAIRGVGRRTAEGECVRVNGTVNGHGCRLKSVNDFWPKIYRRLAEVPPKVNANCPPQSLFAVLVNG